MKSVGVVRKIDHLGRVVIPKEIRDVNGWGEKQPVEMFATEDGIFIKAYQNSVDKENALTYLKQQLIDATNDDIRQALQVAITCVSKG